MKAPIDVKKLVWGDPHEKPLLRSKTGPRHITDDEFGWLVEKGLFPHKPKPPRVKKEKPVKPPKVQKTEAEIAHQYAKIIVDKQRTRGMISDKFANLKSEKTINKDLWQDTDFFFSVVFQSRDQKYKFLEFLFEKFNLETDDDGEREIQIINGLKFAEQIGCELKKEVAGDYPTGNIELRQFILDEERK